MKRAITSEISATLQMAASACEAVVSRLQLRTLARVWEASRSFDLAVQLPSGAMVVVRCVAPPDLKDHRALETMVRDGDFDRALLVNCGGGSSHPMPSSPYVAACSVEELPGVLERWAREDAAS